MSDYSVRRVGSIELGYYLAGSEVAWSELEFEGYSAPEGPVGLPRADRLGSELE